MTLDEVLALLEAPSPAALVTYRPVDVRHCHVGGAPAWRALPRATAGALRERYLPG